jgi:NAD(P)-dependent dehydrogenase (short-subunit alcohol dehydrogenase family)
MTTERALRAFDGGVAIVTGGASGIGLAISTELALRGASVVLADVQIELAREAAGRLEDRGSRVMAVELDVTDPAAVKGVVEETLARHQRLDYLFNNAGIMVTGEALRHEIEDVRRVMDVNFFGVTNGILAAYPVMVEQGFGHIVNMASLAGVVPIAGIGYAASKHAVVGASIALRCEAEAHGVQVSVVCPGRIRTAMLLDGGKFGKDVGPTSSEFRERRRKKISEAGYMDAEECAKRTLRGVVRNQAIIAFPNRARRAWRLYRAFPNLAMRFIQLDIARKLKEKGEGDTP